ncbi:hypothetical protein [Streptomyces sp. c-19]|uniref:hypothetical protein n=1 Tax=Streptomyces sp. c-19 TaxID=2789275 RepID=UPI0039800DCD
MKNLRKALAVAAAAVALSTVFATTPAQAARGNFVYSVDGWLHSFEFTNPGDDRCYNTVDVAHSPTNHTDRTAILYRGAGCHDSETVAFYQPGTNGVDHFGSVKFVNW